MTTRTLGRRLRDGAVVTATIMGMVGAQGGVAFAASGYGPSDYDNSTKTPIKHVIVILGENRTFDHVFATYKPKNSNETISNLLSKGIVNADGTPGPNYGAAVQKQGYDYFEFQMAPPSTAYATLPPAVAGGPSTPYGCQAVGVTSGAACDSTANETKVAAVENGMAPDYVATCAENLLVVLQIESAKGVANIDQILAIEGIDVMFIGPHDLSGTVGQLGNLKHPEVAALIARAEDRILRSGIPMGTVPHPGSSALDMFARGYSFVNAGSDVSRLRDSSLADVRAFRQIHRAQETVA